MYRQQKGDMDVLPLFKTPVWQTTCSAPCK